MLAASEFSIVSRPQKPSCRGARPCPRRWREVRDPVPRVVIHGQIGKGSDKLIPEFGALGARSAGTILGSLLKNASALSSAPGSEAEYAVLVVSWLCFRALSDRRPGRQLLSQQADTF